jgi:hypothetical protein
MAYIAKGHKLSYRSLFLRNPLHPRDYLDIIVSSLLFTSLGLCLALLQPCALRVMPITLGNTEYTAMTAALCVACHLCDISTKMFLLSSEDRAEALSYEI